MKKIFIVVAAAAVLAACANEKKDYIASLDSLYNNAIEKIGILKEKGADNPAVYAQMDSLYDAFIEESTALVKEAFKKHSDDSVAVFAVKYAMDMDLLSPDELLEHAEDLSGENAADPEIQNIISVLEVKCKTAEGKKFVDFDVDLPNGRVTSFSDFVGNGSYCLVDFWASWCGPCKAEIPNLKKVYEEYGPKGLEMLSVAVWDKPEDTEAAAAELGIKWHQIINAQRIPTDLYGINGIPHIILFGPDGTILKRNLRGEDIEKEVAKYF